MKVTVCRAAMYLLQCL